MSSAEATSADAGATTASGAAEEAGADDAFPGDRSLATFDPRDPDHWLALVPGTAVLLAVTGPAGALGVLAALVVWWRVGPLYAVVAGYLGATAAEALVASIDAAVLAPAIAPAPGSGLWLLVQAAVGLSLVVVPLTTALAPDPFQTLGAVAAATVTIGGVAGWAMASTGANWAAAAAGLGAALLCGAGVRRYQVVGLARIAARGDARE